MSLLLLPKFAAVLHCNGFNEIMKDLISIVYASRISAWWVIFLPLGFSPPVSGLHSLTFVPRVLPYFS